jgi:hypothetical protein
MRPNRRNLGNKRSHRNKKKTLEMGSLTSLSCKNDYEPNADCTYIDLSSPDNNFWILGTIFHCIKISCTHMAKIKITIFLFGALLLVA